MPHTVSDTQKSILMFALGETEKADGVGQVPNRLSSPRKYRGSFH